MIKSLWRIKGQSLSHTLINNFAVWVYLCGRPGVFHSRPWWEAESRLHVCHVCTSFLANQKERCLLFDRAWNKQLVALHHVLQLAQIAHIVDFPAKLETAEETERGEAQPVNVLMNKNKIGPEWTIKTACTVYFPGCSWRRNIPDDWFEEDQQRFNEHGGMDDIQSLDVLLISKIIKRRDPSVKIIQTTVVYFWHGINAPLTVPILY